MIPSFLFAPKMMVSPASLRCLLVRPTLPSARCFGHEILPDSRLPCPCPPQTSKPKPNPRVSRRLPVRGSVHTHACAQHTHTDVRTHMHTHTLCRNGASGLRPQFSEHPVDRAREPGSPRGRPQGPVLPLRRPAHGGAPESLRNEGGIGSLTFVFTPSEVRMCLWTKWCLSYKSPLMD